jgi:predicted dienelactone hydrolase
MRLALRILGGIFVGVVLAVVCAVAALFLNPATPEHCVSFQQVTVRDRQDKPFDAEIWYPTYSRPGRVLVGFSGRRVAPDGPAAGRNLPLIVISHGNGGLFSSHSDTALALASAGFIVAAVMHRLLQPKAPASSCGECIS